MDLFAAIRAFVRTVERGSMTAAARDLGVSQPAVSKLLRHLEAHLGARVLERSSRALRLTPPGQSFYESIGGTLSAVDAAAAVGRSSAGSACMAPCAWASGTCSGSCRISDTGTPASRSN